MRRVWISCTVAVWLAAMAAASSAHAQEPGVDEEGCTESKLLSRMPGCGIYECSRKEYDAADIVLNMAGQTKSVEGELEQMKLICPSKYSPLQILRNAEAALKKAGYTIVHSGGSDVSEYPIVTARKGAQWITVQTGVFNQFAQYEQIAVLEKAFTQEMTAGAQEIADALSAAGRLDVYGITFATGQATLTPDSEAMLGDVLAVLAAHPDWTLRVEGHTDNVGAAAANLKLSQARAAAVVAWLTAKGVAADRLSAAGFGDTQPVESNATDEGRARNRRVVLVKQ